MRSLFAAFSLLRVSRHVRRFRCMPSIVALLVMVPSARAGGQSVAPTVAHANTIRWVATERATLEKLFSSEDIVARLLDEIVYYGRDVIEHSKVAEYRLVDMYGDGWLELVALVPSRFESCICVIEQEHGDSTVHKPGLSFGGFAIRDVVGHAGWLDMVLQDLDGDGKPEIVVGQELEVILPFQVSNADPHAIIPEIYHWNGIQFADSSSKFGWYYTQNVIPQLEREAQELASTNLLPLSDDERRTLSISKANNAALLAEARQRAAAK
jgi:hypothetical protein